MLNKSKQYRMAILQVLYLYRDTARTSPSSQLTHQQNYREQQGDRSTIEASVRRKHSVKIRGVGSGGLQRCVSGFPPMAFAAEVPEHLSFLSGAKSSNNQLVTHTASQLTSR